MKRVSLLILLGLLIQSCGSQFYQIKSKKYYETTNEFIFPPHTKLEWDKEKESIKKQHRYQYVYIDNLIKIDGAYFQSLKSLNAAQYFTSKWSIEEICFEKGCIGPKIINKNKSIRKASALGINEITESVGDFAEIKYSKDGRALLIQIDYSLILQSKEETPFFLLAKDLLVELSKKEDPLGWPTSISQSIVERVFELIPSPKSATLYRYICKIQDDESFVLLNSKIILRVDHVIEEKPDGGADSDWFYKFLGRSYLRLLRNKNGNFIQTPFLGNNKNLPLNDYKDKTSIHLASSVDIQLSKGTQNLPYIFLQQENLKRNNGKSKKAKCKSAADLKPSLCNSVLYHFRDLKKGTYDTSQKRIDPNLASYNSTYGIRSVIVPCIEINLNNKIVIVDLNTTLYQVLSKYNFPSNLKLRRKDGGRLVKINFFKDLVLLPGDEITFKL